MQNCTQIAADLYYLGGNDRRLALFESAYPIPRGVSYNSYLLKDEKNVLFDTVDNAIGEQFFENLACALGEDKLDYVVVHHMEPDHSATFARLVERYPDVTVITSQKAAAMLKNYFGFAGKVHLVKEGDALPIGKRTLKFVAAPMVHWPEVLFTYVPEDGILFSADAFGTFGALSGSVMADREIFERDYLDDARRYYFNIVGKYGVQVQNVLKKAAGLKISLVCPLHGPVWGEGFGWYLDKYLTWSAYEPEEKSVAVFYASVYGHTQNAAEIVASAIAAEGVRVRVYDVSVTHVSELLAEAFRASHAVFASTTYNNGIFVSMENFLNDLKAHNFQNRAYAVIENGSWAPQAGALMDGVLSPLKNMRRIGEKTTVLSAVSADSAAALRALGRQIAGDVKAN
ncbi:MAG TPA: FprA family A-type flavoprotein [Firmicutes bacterium]|nr:FprA family A-type flavoprotein [Bacillota bacterium]